MKTLFIDYDPVCGIHFEIIDGATNEKVKEGNCYFDEFIQMINIDEIERIQIRNAPQGSEQVFQKLFAM